MKKIVVLVAMVAFLAMAVVAFGAPAAPAGDLKISKAEGAEKKPPVNYNHEKHMASAPDCKSCHHTWDGEGAVKKCSECHKAKKDGKKLDSKNAAHKTCRGCHRGMKKAEKKTGPTPCKGCHIK